MVDEVTVNVYVNAPTPPDASAVVPVTAYTPARRPVGDSVTRPELLTTTSEEFADEVSVKVTP